MIDRSRYRSHSTGGTAPDGHHDWGKIKRRLEGVRFGRLVVVRYGGAAMTPLYNSSYGRKEVWRRLWVCKCDCDGNERTYREDILLRKDMPVRSCGCLRGMPCGHARGLTVSEKEAGRRANSHAKALRMEDRDLVMPWQEAMRQALELRQIPRRLLAERWGRRLSQLAELFSRQAPRAPTPEEAMILAQALNLRGMEKTRFLDLAKEAREAVERKRLRRQTKQQEVVHETAQASV